jgi:hypothetical protein
MLGDVMAKQRTVSRATMIAIALATIFGLLFMHGVTPATATSAHCQEAQAHHHEHAAMDQHSDAVESQSHAPTTDHDACVSNHTQHPCAGTVRKTIHVTADLSPITFDYNGTNGFAATTTASRATYGGLSPPPPDLHMLCISRK